MAIPESIFTIAPTFLGMVISILDNPVSIIILESYWGKTKLMLLAPLSIYSFSTLKPDKLQSVLIAPVLIDKSYIILLFNFNCQ